MNRLLSDKKLHWALIGPAVILKRTRKSRRIPNLIRPKTFNEKILHRILFDRRDFLREFSGKIESRKYVLDKVADPSLLIDLVGTARDSHELCKLNLPSKFIVKSNHMSGRTFICDGSSPVDIESLGKMISTWCKESSRLQWGYQHVEQTAVIEHLLETESGIPNDYKFFCYSGRVHFVQVDGSRFSDHRRDFFDPAWNHIPAVLSYRNEPTPPSRPAQLNQMIQIAEAVSAGIDFVRVDLYEVGDQIKFGELTCYPGSGMEVFVPRAWDEVFGRPWIMTTAGHAPRP
ncbi:MAG TPA: ATP-grasp fold amidoligase family protein [Falsiroseomonas sp.]|nr:ATP-grasp fold amidoligase family protein [Falsiroseomonas sp.]